MFVEPHNGPILHEHVKQSLHIPLDETPPILVHLSTPIAGNYLPI
jgi:hypothetical protein